MIVYGPEVKTPSDFREHGRSTLRCRQWGIEANMPSTVDGLLVALFVALAPPDQESPLPAATDSLRQGFQQGYEGLKLGAEGDAARCRYYVNATARGNCVARMKRSLSGAPDIPPAFPNETIWIAPGDPGMPIKFHPNTLR